MTKTQYYNLNKPEATDPIRLADFNENADIIDGLLKSQADGLAAVNTAISSKGNCRIAWGTYTGTGAVGASNPNSLNFGFYPVMVWISGNSTGSSWLRKGETIRYNTSGGYEFVMTWSDNGISWYHDSDFYDSQYNTSGETYYYYAIGV